jgi:hypothetical protein
MVVTQLDNGVGNTSYQVYKKGDNSFFSNNLNGFIKVGISDLFKDYRFIGGFKILTTLRGAEFFLTYEDMKSKLDKRFTVYRRSETKSDDGEYFYRQSSVEGKYDIKYPFSEISCVRGGAFLRNDKNTYLTSDKSALEKPNDNLFWVGYKAEYIFDNSYATNNSHRIGTRLKVYNEYFKSVTQKKHHFIYHWYRCTSLYRRG